ncbi:fasciclin domain-containing protein [Christiangramia sabulilitoris]|uniref:Fasciclin domain-containing protein n=1 Tax=Christiangramia sabulilitoris TaxID=2583991 RepID=A0A550I809_9FLAO|nr:fasciclin domain-containing protein [Christiangramia sabulilitoris]TRO67112.1 fasciclin domain-containing protein [Christiangramia sabulilitoris]
MKKNFRLQKLFIKSLFLAFIFVVSACESEPVEADISSFDANARASEKANPSPASNKGDLTIAEIVVANATNEEAPQFTLLLAALEYAGITSLFAGGDQYTVFAPTDAAFLELLGGDPANLQTLSPAEVAAVLSYHVTEGRRFSNSVVPKNSPREIETLLELPFYVYSPMVDESGNTVIGIDTNDADTEADANILTPNISASNGVIHVIDAVLMPAE